MPEATTYSTAETPDEPNSKDGLTEFHRRMLDRYDRSIAADSENRLAAVDDLCFRAGVQWPSTLQAQREQDERPVLTINEIPKYVRQVTGDIRQNTPSIKVLPVDDGADKAIAEILNGLIRNIEQQSHARYVYSSGGDSAVTAGFGAWRIVTQYTDDDSFEQDIRIKPIQNALSVVWDPLSTEFNKSDGNFCFVHYRLPKSEFKAQYPDAAVVDFEVTQDDRDAASLRSWFDGEGVRVAEYWCKEPVTKKICKLQDGSVIDCGGLSDEQLMALGPMMNGAKPHVREVKSHKIVQYIVSGKEILDGPNDWAGKYIPIIHVPGEEVWVGENRVTHGLVRFMKDPQRLKNYMRSCSAEVVGQQPKMPWILTAQMIAGHEADWQNAGKSGKPYLLWNPDPEFPGLKPERSNPPVPAIGLAEEAAMASEDFHSVTGIYPASLGQKSNESSGIAIRQREQQGDTGTFVYIDNVSLAIAHTGEQLVDLIPRIYDTERVVRVLGENGEHNMVPINKEIVVKGQNGTERKIKFDLTVGKYDVDVVTGPSFATLRQEAGNGMLEFIRSVPEAGPLVGDLLADLQEWPQKEKVKERLEVLLPPQLQPQKMGPDGNPLPPPAPPPDPKMIEMQGKQQLAQAQHEADQQMAAQKAQMELAQADHKSELEQITAQRKFALMQWEAQQQAALNRWIAEQELITERVRAGLQANLNEAQANHDMNLEAVSLAHDMQINAVDQAHGMQMDHINAQQKADQAEQASTTE